MHAAEIVSVRNLVFEYPGMRALDDVTFTLARGSVTALVGPNGAGKTTLLRCMAALESPLQGEIHIDGVDVLEQPRESHRRLGYLSDFFGLYDALTVRRSLLYAALSQGMAEPPPRPPPSERRRGCSSPTSWTCPAGSCRAGSASAWP